MTTARTQLTSSYIDALDWMVGRSSQTQVDPSKASDLSVRMLVVESRPWAWRLAAFVGLLEAYDVPPNETAKSNAIRVLTELSSLSWAPSRVAASAEGVVAFIFEGNGRYADIECLNDGEVLVGLTDFESRNEVFELQVITPSAVGDLRERVEQFLGSDGSCEAAE